MIARTGRDGLLCARIERRGGVSVVARSRWTLPLQILAPVALDDPAAILSVLNPTGGLVGGDRLDLAIDVGPGAHACVTTPSATKVYRTAGAAAEQTVTLRVAAGATLEWVPDHTIPFAGSALRQTIEVSVDRGARLILVDAFAAGRVARDETWRFAHLESALSVRDEAGWLFHDRFVLGGGSGLTIDGVGVAEGCRYFATVLVVGDGDAAGLVSVVSAIEAARVAAAPLPRGGLAVRVLAPTAPALTECLDRICAAARRALLGLGPLALRKA